VRFRAASSNANAPNFLLFPHTRTSQVSNFNFFSTGVAWCFDSTDGTWIATDATDSQMRPDSTDATDGADARHEGRNIIIQGSWWLCTEFGEARTDRVGCPATRKRERPEERSEEGAEIRRHHFNRQGIYIYKRLKGVFLFFLGRDSNLLAITQTRQSQQR
jgi:hypothetical protein